jgi:hypothetical protein
MIVRALDINGDFSFGRGKSNYKIGIDAIKQNIQTRLKSWKGDCFFALNDGVDYENFLDKNTKVFLDNDIKRVILQSYGVIRIDSFSSEIVDRDYTATTTVMTVYGIINTGV